MLLLCQRAGFSRFWHWYALSKKHFRNVFISSYLSEYDLPSSDEHEKIHLKSFKLWKNVNLFEFELGSCDIFLLKTGSTLTQRWLLRALCTSYFSHRGIRRTPDCTCHIHPLVYVIHACFPTHSRTIIQRRTIFTRSLPDSHCCWHTGRAAHWDKTPAAPDGSLAPAAKVSMLHNHSQLVR